MKRTIGVIAPSLPSVGVRQEKIEKAIRFLEESGNCVKVAPSVFNKAQYKAAPAKIRAAEFCELMADPLIDVVLCTTGGYNSNEMLQYFDWTMLQKARAAVVGYSDVTVLLLALYARTKLPLVQGAMLVDWVDYPEVFDDLWRVLDEVPGPLKNPSILWEPGGSVRLEAPPLTTLRQGNHSACGPVIAGNLSTFNLLLGTPFLPSLAGSILMLEYDKEENFCLPSLERLLWQLRLSGCFEEIAALVFGVLQPAVQEEETREGRTIAQILTELTDGLAFPVFFNAPFGHLYPSWQVRQGSRCCIDEQGLTVIT
jgi:muramoyltetrapeptide carboxypeptidase